MFDLYQQITSTMKDQCTQPIWFRLSHLMAFYNTEQIPYLLIIQHRVLVRLYLCSIQRKLPEIIISDKHLVII